MALSAGGLGHFIALSVHFDGAGQKDAVIGGQKDGFREAEGVLINEVGKEPMNGRAAFPMQVPPDGMAVAQKRTACMAVAQVGVANAHDKRTVLAVQLGDVEATVDAEVAFGRFGRRTAKPQLSVRLAVARFGRFEGVSNPKTGLALFVGQRQKPHFVVASLAAPSHAVAVVCHEVLQRSGPVIVHVVSQEKADESAKSAKSARSVEQRLAPCSEKFAKDTGLCALVLHVQPRLAWLPGFDVEKVEDAQPPRTRGVLYTGDGVAALDVLLHRAAERCASVASVLVVLEFLDGEPLCASLEALGQARRLGSALGLSVCALAAMESVGQEHRERLGPLLGYYGADTVTLLTADEPKPCEELRFAPYARALLQATDELPPRLFLMADTPAGREIAPRMAARTNGVFLARGDAVCEQAELRFYDGDGRRVELEEPDEIDLTMPPPVTSVMITVPAGRYALSRGSEPASVRFAAALADENPSERTPVPGTGFVEDSVRRYRPGEVFFWREKETVTEQTVPPVFAVLCDECFADRRSACVRVGIGANPAGQDDVQLLLPLVDPKTQNTAGLLAAVEAALKKPWERRWTPPLSALPQPVNDDKEPALTIARPWEGVDMSTGDTEPHTAATTASEDDAITPSPTPETTAKAFPLVEGADENMWDDDLGLAKTQEAAPIVEESAPMVEQEEVVTAPIDDSSEDENSLETKDAVVARDEPGKERS